MAIPSARSLLASLFALMSAHAAIAQFVPGPNPIIGTEGAQTLSSGTGTVNAGGAISVSGSTTALTMTGTSTLNNNGTIEATGSGRAIDSNAVSNLTVTNTGMISANSTDAFRVNTASSSVSLVNSGTIRVTNGGQAIDWAAITTGANSLTNQLGGNITAVGEDAVRPGQNGIVINAGTIAATPTGGASPSGSDGIDLRTQKTVTVTNTGTISGRHGIATDGANVGPSSLTVNNNAGVITAINGSGINVDGVNTTVVANVTNAAGATIQGAVLAIATNGDGDGIDVDGVLTLNNSGSVFGYGAKGVGSDGQPNHAQAISIGGGSVTNTATGQIIGSTLAADAPGGDITRAGEGILVDNSSGGNAIAATAIYNSGLIQGKTGAAIRIVGTFADTVTNESGGAIRGAGSGAAVRTGDGADTVTNRGAIVSDNNNAIDLEVGDDTLAVEGGAASITGNISGGTGTNTMTINAGSGNTFSFAHQINGFSTLTVVEGRFDLASTALVNATSLVVENGGILAGTGEVNGAVSLENGGVIAAGHSPGTLHLDSLALENGSRFEFELGAAPGSSDLVDVAGLLSFSDAGSAIFDIIDNGLTVGTYDLITFSSISGLSLGNLSFGLTPSGFAGNFLIDGDSVSLVVSAIPEPASVAAGLGFLAMLAVMRFRRRSVAA